MISLIVLSVLNIVLVIMGFYYMIKMVRDSK